MAFDRNPTTLKRMRRTIQQIAAGGVATDGQSIGVDEDGALFVRVDSAGGLATTGAGLALKLADLRGLTFSDGALATDLDSFSLTQVNYGFGLTNKIGVKRAPAGGINSDENGISVALSATGGLQIVSNSVAIKLATGSGLLLNANGLAMDPGALPAHEHAIADVTDLQTTLDGLATDAQLSAVASDLAELAIDVADAESAIGTIAGEITALQGDVGTLQADVGDLQTAVALKQDALPLMAKGDVLVHDGTGLARVGIGSDGQVLSADSSAAAGVSWTSAGGAHTHPISDIIDLQAELDGKAATGHGHGITDVVGLAAVLDTKQDVLDYVHLDWQVNGNAGAYTKPAGAGGWQTIPFGRVVYASDPGMVLSGGGVFLPAARWFFVLSFNMKNCGSVASRIGYWNGSSVVALMNSDFGDSALTSRHVVTGIIDSPTGAFHYAQVWGSVANAAADAMGSTPFSWSNASLVFVRISS